MKDIVLRSWHTSNLGLVDATAQLSRRDITFVAVSNTMLVCIPPDP